MFSNLFAIAASAFAAWAVIRYLILIEIRIDENSFKIIYDISKNSKIILVEEEFTHENKYPITFFAFCFLKDCPSFYLSHEERLMQAGWTAKDYVSKIILFRHNYKKLKSFLRDCHKKNPNVQVDLLIPYSSDKIGHIKNKNISPVILNNLCEDFEKEIANKQKTSALFYGPPGNGKTTFIKYLATKYNLPIKLISLSPDFSNYELLLLFSQIPNNCIVLFEDFDNYFHGRKCVMGEDNKNIKFTFDVILNGLDGIYNTYENVVFIMTTNDIGKIDDSLKNRPSRFKYVIDFPNPGPEIIEKILGSYDEALKLKGMNLDQILTVKEYRRSVGIDEAIKRINH